MSKRNDGRDEITLTEEMIDAFGKAWQAEDDRAKGWLRPGQRRAAGLSAVIKLIERDYDLAPKPKAKDPYPYAGQPQ